MRHRILLATSFVYLAVANLIWIARDTRPPFWDMAAHQGSALRILDAVGTEGLAGLANASRLTLPYPPLYHSVVAAFYALFGRTVDAAQYANLPAMLILLLCTYGIGLTVLSPLAAAFSATLVSFYPMLLWLSRETIIDYWLTSMVAASIWMLLQTRSFSSRRWAIAFGVVAGLGMLTKWTFPFFIALPFLYFARENWRNAAIAAAIAGAIASAWYLPAAPAMVDLLRINSGQSVTEGDPGRWSWQAVVFYVRALEGYQLFLPLFAAFIVGLLLLVTRFKQPWVPIFLWIVSGWLGLLLFQNKDPRYSVPLLPAIALITATIVERRRSLTSPVIILPVILPMMAFLLIQHYVVSFGIRRLPETVVLEKGVEGPLSWNWNLYTQSYFDLWGAPAKQDWRIDYVLKQISRTDGQVVRLGMVPDIPRFDWMAFQFYAALEHFPVSVDRFLVADESAIARTDFILMSERDQGPSYAAPDVTTVNNYILSRPDRFRILEWFPLPNGDVIRLYRVEHL